MIVRPILLLLTGLLLAACQPAPETTGKRAVTVSGEAELTVAPELASVRLSIQARDRDLGAAQEQAARTVTAVLEIADSLEIPRSQLQSSQLRVQPEFDWRDGQQALRGYLVHRDIRIELTALDMLGALVERAMRAGVNDISPPELRVRDPRQVHREVLRLAAEDARANAEILAEALDARLGKVNSINAVEQNEAPVRPMELQVMRSDANAGAEESYEAGRITVRARIRAEFELR